MLGLLYNEIGDTEKSLKYLKLATQKQPPISRAFYNYALQLQGQKKYAQSVAIIDKALIKFPGNENLLYIKLLGEMNSNQKKQAKKTIKLLLQLKPNNPNYQQIYKNLRADPPPCFTLSMRV